LNRPSSELDVVPCGVLQTLADGTIRRVNRTFCGWLDAPAETLIGRRFQDLLTIGGKIFHHTHWAPLLRLQGSISEVKLELVHGDGVIPILINVIRRDDDGTIVHEIAAYVARDRDRYEKELVLARQRLETALAELKELHEAVKDRAVFAEQMVGIVSHDLRNPLGAVRLGAEMLAMTELSEPQRGVLARIERAAERSTHLIEDLLDFTKARVGNGIAVTLAPINLHECVAACLDELRLSHPARELLHVVHGEGPCIADPRRLAQLIGNLVSNANAYGELSTPITVTSSLGAACVIAVHNRGPQIPSEVQATMFEPMTRGQSAAGNARSVGLGLYIVREIARAHGGTASVASVATGTTFRVEWRVA
jgi:sigma-B regulation protein RsbU (phosphoserine phosphatase)